VTAKSSGLNVLVPEGGDFKVKTTFNIFWEISAIYAEFNDLCKPSLARVLGFQLVQYANTTLIMVIVFLILLWIMLLNSDFHGILKEFVFYS
jgi:hypothetical protein